MIRIALLSLLIACGGKSHPRPAQPDDHDEQATNEPGHEGDDDTLPQVTPVDHDLHSEAMRIVAATKRSTYVHRTTVDEAAGRFEVDCSGLVDYALARTKPNALAEVQGDARKRPLAKDFVIHLRSLPPEGRGAWSPIANALELLPGDVIAWLRPHDVRTKNTGHVMIVRDTPRVDPDDHDVLIVPVIDSTAVPHGTGDSRKASKTTGVGTGDVLLLLDDAKQPIAYRWSRGTKAKPHTTTIALGRLR